MMHLTGTLKIELQYESLVQGKILRPKDYLKRKLFPFSFADKASRWFKSLPPGLITLWEGCRSGFVNHFYTKSRSNSLRNKLQGFQQGLVESFYEAWERFKDYECDYPHHGFPEGKLISISIKDCMPNCNCHSIRRARLHN